MIRMETQQLYVVQCFCRVFQSHTARTQLRHTSAQAVPGCQHIPRAHTLWNHLFDGPLQLAGAAIAAAHGQRQHAVEDAHVCAGACGR